MKDNSEIKQGDNLDKLKTERNKTLITIGILIIFNTTMFVLFAKGLDFKNNLVASLNANLIGFNIIGFILGTIFALFPYKGLSYSKKYLRASLRTVFVLHTIMAIGLIFIALMTLIGCY